MTMDIATLGIRVDSTDVRGATVELDRLGAAGGRTATSMSSVERASKNLMGVFAGLGLGAFAKDILATNREMESLRASLLSVTGSSRVATSAFDSMKQLAKETPFEIKGLTQSFIVLQNMGIKPTHQVMDALTNQAAKLGGSQETLTSIVMQLGQAHSKGKLQMQDMHILMERGVPVMKLLTEVTGKNSAELMKMSEKGTLTNDIIDKMIIKMGELASGSNAIAMNTLNGKISSLSDAWHDFEDTLMGDTSEGFIKKIVGNWTEWLDFFKDSIAGVGKEFAALEEINNKIVTSKAKISAMSQGGIAGAAWTVAGALTGNSVAGEENRLASFIKQREVIIKTTHDVIVAKNEEKAATDKLLNSAVEEKKVLQESSEAKKAAEKAAKAAAKAQDDITKGSLKEIDSLSDKHKKMTLSERDYYAQSDAIKNMTPAQKAWAMAQWDVNNAQEVQNKGIDYAKSKLSELKDKYEVLTLSARDYLAATMLANKVPEAEQKKVLTQFDKNTGAAAEKEKANALKKSHEDATNALQKYNDTIDSTGQKTQDLSSINSAIFDGALGGINTLVGALGTMSDALGNNSKEMERLNAEKDKISKYQPDMDKDNYIKDLKLKTDAAKKNNKEISDLEKKSLNDALNGTRQTAAAAAKMFGEKTVAAKAFHAIENGIAVAQMAMKVKDMAISSMATVKSFIAGAAKMFEQSGWLGFAGVAAMAALMAGLGFSMSGGGGSSAPPLSDTGTGTVLGDSSAKSESLAKTNDLLKNIHASEYVELRGINAGVNNLSKSILNTVTQLFQGGGLSQVSLSPETLGGLGAIWDKVTFAFTGLDPIAKFVGNFLFGGKKTQSVVGQGIETWGTPLNGVIEGGNVQAGQYADIKTHTSGGLLTKSKDSYSTSYQAVGSDIQKALNDVFKNVGTNLMVVAKSLGNNLTDTVKKAIIPAMRVDLMGLTGEDAAKKLNSVIGATMDTMSATIFGEIVGQYQQLGEGMFETAVRIVAEVEIVKDAFAQSGKAMPKLSINAISMADALVQAAGGLEEFQKRFEGFIDKFTTDAEKQTRTRKYLQGAFRDNDLFNGKQIGRMLNSRDAYGNAVDAAAADVAKYAGKTGAKNIAAEKTAVDKYSLLLEMAPKVDEFISYNEKLTKDTLDMNIKLYQSQGNGLEVSKLVLKSHAAELKLLPESLRGTQQKIWDQEIINKQTALSNTLMKAQGRTAEALAISRQKELDAMEPSLRATQEAINKQEDMNKTQNLSWQLLELQGKSEQVLNEKRAVALLGLSATDAEIQRAINTQEDLKKATENAKIAEQDLAKVRAEALTNAQGATSKAMAVLQKAVDAERKQLTTKYNADIKTSQTAVDLLSTSVDKLKSLSTSLKNALAGMVAPNSDAVNRKNAQAFIATALILAKSGMAGSIDEAKLNDALGVVAKPSEALFSTFEDYQRDFLKTSIDISNLSDATESQATKAMTQLDVAKAQLEAITTGYEAESLRLDAILTSAQDQIDAINGTTIAVMSIADALKNLGGSLSTLDARQNPVDSMYKNLLGRESDTAGADYWKSNLASGSSPSDIAGGFVTSAEFTNNANATGDAIKSMYQTLLGRLPDAAGYDYWKSSLNSGATVADIATSIMQSDEYAKIKAVRGYASGGTHDGGWRIVGENGPELENTGASRIFSNPQSKSLLSMDELVAELQALRAEMRAGQEAIANNTRQTTKILRDVTQDGTSITTTAAV
jgi:tape measure domain-containing protein